MSLLNDCQNVGMELGGCVGLAEVSACIQGFYGGPFCLLWFAFAGVC